ncbi:glycosyltransferase family 2 protein [Candidatus Uhrbacteria bacterium]|nr:glycosyltransferase family 2 protein [Candidatus Uhrbacteria bacterium]
MQQSADIAVIIPCYNHTNVLRRTLEALKKQTIPVKEVIVVDDGSNDHPFELVKQAFPEVIDAGTVFHKTGTNGISVTEIDPKLFQGEEKKQDISRIVYIRLEKNSGAPVARNLGAAISRASFIIFLDADAELVPSALETFLQALEDHPEAEYAYANFRWGNRLFKSRTFDPDFLKQANYIHTSSLIRRTAFPGFDESLKKFQDWDVWLTMAKQGKIGVWIDKELYKIEPRKRGKGMSTWLPSFFHHLPWHIIGWIPKEIKNYRDAEQVIRIKHSL